MAEFKGTREAFAAALYEMAAENDKVVGVFPDSLKAMRAVPFGETYPDRYIECGIAEQCAVDVAAGLASAGMLPFVGTSIPNFTVLTPADPEQLYEAVKYAAEIQGPVYIRGGSGREVDVYAKDAPFSKDGITVWKEYGTDAVLFSNGYVFDRVLAAADLLKEQGINVTVADINILYGKDPSKILDVMAKTSQIVTVEDHNINGGLGSYISRLATENQPVKVKRIALTDFAESGPAKELADAYGYAPEKIAATVKETLGK